MNESDPQEPELPDEASHTEPLSSAGQSARVAELETKVVELERNWMRSQADYQNLRRRLQGDIDAAVQRQKNALLTDLLLVLDYLEMALKSPCTSEEARNLAIGVEMTRGALVRALERDSVQPVRDSGLFDASIHQAVESLESNEHVPGTILSVLRKGYSATGGVLRPAQVRVSTGRATSNDAKSEAAPREDTGWSA